MSGIIKLWLLEYIYVIAVGLTFSREKEGLKKSRSDH